MFLSAQRMLELTVQCRKLLTVRRIGDKVGKPIVAGSWGDVVNTFRGNSPRIFFPNGDEIEVKDWTNEYFQLLPALQVLYVAPNGEEFNAIEGS